MSQQTLILVGVFIYFGVGAVIACSMTMLSMGFAGKFEPMAIAIFFFWPIFYLLQLPAILYVLCGIAAASFMTWLAWLAIHALQ